MTVVFCFPNDVCTQRQSDQILGARPVNRRIRLQFWKLTEWNSLGLSVGVSSSMTLSKFCSLYFHQVGASNKSLQQKGVRVDMFAFKQISATGTMRSVVNTVYVVLYVSVFIPRYKICRCDFYNSLAGYLLQYQKYILTSLYGKKVIRAITRPYNYKRESISCYQRKKNLNYKWTFDYFTSFFSLVLFLLVVVWYF